jgi:hypothetical protein
MRLLLLGMYYVLLMIQIVLFSAADGTLKVWFKVTFKIPVQEQVFLIKFWV